VTPPLSFLRSRLEALMADLHLEALTCVEEDAEEWADALTATAGWAAFLFGEPSALAMLDQARADAERRVLAR